MDSSYDAQRNEFCAYVLHESETPFGLTLGNFKTYAHSTAKGGVRGLWDADTDQIIFGAHQIAYRVSRSPTLFPHQIKRELTFLAVRADLRVRARRPPARHRSVLRSARPDARSGRRLRRRRDALQSGRRGDATSRSFPGRCSSASASTASPKTKCAPGTTDASSARAISKPAASAGGAVRARRSPSSSRCANRCCSRRCAAATLVKRESAPTSTR